MLQPMYDVVIVGSGFGGSITACRLAQAQRGAGRKVSVAVLERGKRYHRGEFPRDWARPKDWIWKNEGRDGWRGLIEFRSFDGIRVMVGSGVGGTSLVYLDVQIDARDSVFQAPRWPQSVDWRSEMPRYYAKLHDMLRPTPIPEPRLKTQALRAAAEGAGLGSHFFLPDLAIYWGHNGSQPGVLDPDPYGRGGPPQIACQNCAECFIGCNTHSKNTMDLTYLWFAERAGAEVFSQHRVDAIERAPDGRYTVHYTDLRWNLTGRVSARILVIAAGVMGSTSLLLRSKLGYRRGRRTAPPTLPALSDQLGRYFSGNGDFGGVAFRTRRVTNPMDGPTITGAVDCRDQLGGRSFVIEDGGLPDFLRAQLRDLPGGLAAGRPAVRWLRRLFTAPSPNRALAQGIFNFLDFDAVRDMLLYLCMGIDQADGVISIDADGELKIHWPYEPSLPYFREVEKTLAAMTQSPELDGALFINPTWTTAKQLITLHPLGGCPMGDDASHGVVNPQGAVFHYPHLYVIDGSIVPSALGPNPSKTIGALAERAVEHMVREELGL